MTEFWLDLLYPKTCVRCLNEGHYICFPLKQITSQEYFSSKANPLDGLLASDFFSDEGLKQAIHIMKYDSVKGVGEVLGERLRSSFGHLTKSDDLVVPVPLFPKRQKLRGFNQARVIAEAFAGERLNVVDALKRTHFIRRQIGLSKKERLENVSQAFSAAKDILEVRGKTVYLIDDVATTGATLGQCAKLLKKAGAKKVIGLVAARD